MPRHERHCVTEVIEGGAQLGILLATRIKAALRLGAVDTGFLDLSLRYGQG